MSDSKTHQVILDLRSQESKEDTTPTVDIVLKVTLGELALAWLADNGFTEVGSMKYTFNGTKETGTLSSDGDRKGERELTRREQKDGVSFAPVTSVRGGKDEEEEEEEEDDDDALLDRLLEGEEDENGEFNTPLSASEFNDEVIYSDTIISEEPTDTYLPEPIQEAIIEDLDPDDVRVIA